MILGCGIDLVEVARFERELVRRRSGDHYGAMADKFRRRSEGFVRLRPPTPDSALRATTGFGAASADLAPSEAGDFDDVLTPGEIARSQALRRPVVGYAAGFAAKEACFKALGTGKVGAMSWHDVEIGREDGRYTVTLGGETAAVAQKIGVDTIHLSLASTRAEVVALVITCGPPSLG